MNRLFLVQLFFRTIPEHNASAGEVNEKLHSETCVPKMRNVLKYTRGTANMFKVHLNNLVLNPPRTRYRAGC